MDMAKLKYVIEKVLKRFPDVSYSMKEANTTNSVYVRFFYNGRKKTIRISDHPTHNIMPTILGKTNLENFLVNNIKKLKHSHLYDLFEDIERSSKC